MLFYFTNEWVIMKNQTIGLIIAGSDCSGAAGMQADLKTFASLQVYATTVFTCLTAQNGEKWYLDTAVAPRMITAQLTAICDHYDFTYVKLGMLYNLKIMKLISDYFANKPQYKLIVDPVMACKNNNGQPDAQEATFYLQHLIPQGYVTTPNVIEAEALLQMKITNKQDLVVAAKELYKLTKTNVLMKGGHLADTTITDVFYDGINCHTWETQFINNNCVNGAGCTLASALTCYLIQSKPLIDASYLALQYVHTAIKNGIVLTKGVNPLNQTMFCAHKQTS